MHQLGSALEDQQRWRQHPEEEDTMIRTGAVTAMRKALFEGGEAFALSEEKKVLHSLRGRRSVSRSLLRTNIPDRSHLVRESARILWTSLTWHFDFFFGGSSSANWGDGQSWNTTLSKVDEAHLPDGESADLPTSSFSASAATLFFTFLSDSVQISKALDTRQDSSGTSSEVITDWDSSNQELLAQLREQTGSERAMFHHFAVLIHHWTRIRTLRTHFEQADAVLVRQGPMTQLITSCREALVELQKIVTVADVELSVFQPMITLVKIDATLLLALHLLAQSRTQHYNVSADWHDIRSLISTSLLLVWSQEAEGISARLGSNQSWRKSCRQLIEQVLLEAFNRKQSAMQQHISVKEEGTAQSNEEDRLDHHLGPLNNEDPLRIYQEELLADDPIYRQARFFDILDGKFARRIWFSKMDSRLRLLLQLKQNTFGHLEDARTPRTCLAL